MRATHFRVIQIINSFSAFRNFFIKRLEYSTCLILI